jgi:hypothetical protein
MKRKASALTFILSLLVSVLAGTLPIQNAARELIVRGDADTNSSGVIGSPGANITITSPENKVYSTDNVTVAFKIESGIPLTNNVVLAHYLRYGCLLDHSFSIKTYVYLDDAGNKITYNHTDWESNVDLVLSRYEDGYLCNATLTKLSEGPHNITAWAEERINYLSYDIIVGSVYSTVQFNVDLLPPSISILSPENKAYNTSDVPLDFTVNEAVVHISYSLDGQENVTAAGNMTLTRLSNGAHNVTVYAADEAGNIGASETATFTVAVPEPFPTAPVAVASVAAVALVSVGLLVYFKKRKKESGNKS